MDKQQGMIVIVGIGPGSTDDMTLRARNALSFCDTIVGYTTYIALIKSLTEGKDIIQSGMTREVERCQRALDEARKGKKVALVSGGDSGIYGMAGLLFELAETRQQTKDIQIEIIPGVPAFVAAAAVLGAPLMNDFAAISLSDLLTPWDKIETRLTAAATGDFVTCLYNPKSRKRTVHLERAIAIFAKFRHEETPCAIIKNVSRPQQKVTRTELKHLLEYEIDMLSLVIIGNTETRFYGNWMITPRGYRL